MQFNVSKKTVKILRSYAKDPKKILRLQEYLDSVDRLSKKRSSSPELDSPSSKKRRFRNKGSSLEKCDKYDNSLSGYFSEDGSKHENFVNISLRNVYSKSNLPQVSSTPRSGDDLENVDTNLGTSEAILDEVSWKNQRVNEVKKKVKRNPDDDIVRENKILFFNKSTVKFSDVGGVNNILEEICQTVIHIGDPSLYPRFGEEFPPCGLLLHGPSGCGKTLIVRAVAGELDLHLIEVNATELTSEKKIYELFEGAINSAPCILFIDKIDSITLKKEAAQKEMEIRIFTQLLQCMDDLNSMKTPVMVIGATNRPHLLDPELQTAGRFDQEISIGIPDENARYEILKIVCDKLPLSPDVDLHWLASNTPGYLGADLKAIKKIAVKNAIIRNLDKSVGSRCNLSSDPFLVRSWLKTREVVTNIIEIEDFVAAIRRYVPSTKKEGFPEIPNITWEDIGALDHIKEELRKKVLWPIMYKREFQKYHIPSTTGILLYGPKGCGKTLLAKALANEGRINFLSVKGPELLNKFVGESEAAVRKCFQKARNTAPCVIFFDEIDALCPNRGNSNENAVSDRVVAQLLSEIDGVEGQKQIFIIGATNRRDCIDSAMLRPGRLGEEIFVGPPNEADRLDILRRITGNGTKLNLAADVSLVEISSDERCVGFSGADLNRLVAEASTKAFEDYYVTRKGVYEVKSCHFDYAMNKIKPSISERDFYCF